MIFCPVASERDLQSGFGLQKCFIWSTVDSLQAFKKQKLLHKSFRLLARGGSGVCKATGAIDYESCIYGDPCPSGHAAPPPYPPLPPSLFFFFFLLPGLAPGGISDYNP